ncbi:MAG TPA: NAD(P)/FAD-dependent oxidoreductase [Solirubrobacterales bacterium]|nr:NAD(P)/FAD-dependent oxidoreductase [Solirubrobacterales bacterium]
MIPAAGSAPVIVVGAGLAGLKCALVLRDRGIEVQILEASDGVGGRARTDLVDGFSLDRGFQVLPVRYPEARSTFEYDRLDLGSFVPGARIRIGGTFAKFADPLRMPRSAVGAAASPVGTLADKLKLFQMRRDLTTTDPREIVRRPEVTAIRSLEDRGFSTAMIEYFFRPFFGGVFIDPDLTTSSRLMEIFFRCFSLGDTVLPAGGMGSLANQLAERLPDDAIKLNRKVTSVDSHGVGLDDGSRMDAAAVVVATEESAAASLCGIPEPKRGRTTTCFYFDAPATAIAGPWLVLSPADDGPINELAVPSSVAPGYAPAGRSLVAVSVIGANADRVDLAGAVDRQLSDWFGSETVRSWRPLRTYRIERALPDFDPDRHSPGGESTRLDSGVFICGDHRETPSIQGALVSGRKAAEAIQKSFS